MSPVLSSGTVPDLAPVLDSLTDGVAVIDTDGRFVFANATAARVFGVDSPEALRGKLHDEVLQGLEILDEQGRLVPREALPSRAARRGEYPAEMATRGRVRGQERHLICGARPLFDAAGAVRHVVITLRDVTEQHRSNRSLRLLAEASALLAAAFDSAAILQVVPRLAVRELADICALEVHGAGGVQREVAHRDAAKQELARTVWSRIFPEGSPAFQKVDRSFAPTVFNDLPEAVLDRAIADPAMRQVARDVAPRASLSVPIVARERLLGMMHLVSTEAGYRFDDEVVSLAMELGRRVCLALENARLFEEVRTAVEAVEAAQAQGRVSEERLELALEVGHLGYFDADLVENRGVLSTSMARLVGTDLSRKGGRLEAFLELVHPEDAANVNGRIQAQIQGGADDVFEYRIIRLDGETRWMEQSSRVIRDEQGRPRRLLGVVMDVTERHEAEAKVRELLDELVRSNAELQQFAYIASHDLQEPLRMVAGYTQLLSRRYKGKLDTEADEFIQYAVDGASRMRRLINDLLTFSRVGTKPKAFVPTRCDEVLSRALSNLQAAIAESGAEVTVSPLPEILGDEVQLEQLFQNLVGNALKFKGDKPPKVKVSAERQGAEWRVSVADNGIGIEPKDFDRIFVIFQRLHEKEAYPGTGIGLAICKKIVERHGGRIWVESKPGEGSTFQFTLPVMMAGQAQQQGAA